MQAREHRDSPQWPNTHGGGRRGPGLAGDGCGDLPGWGEMPRAPGSAGFTWACPFVHPLCPSHCWKSWPIVAAPGGLRARPGAARGQIPLAAAAKAGGPGPPSATDPRARAEDTAPRSAPPLQSPEHSLHLCGTGLRRTAGAWVSPRICRQVPAWGHLPELLPVVLG